MEITDPEERILTAARKVFEHDGYNGARMQRIADEAGISKASLHYYFRSKEKLFDKIFDEYLERVLPLFSTWQDDGNDWQNKVRSFMRDLFNVFRETSMLFIIQELGREPAKLEERLTLRRKKPNALVTYYDRLRADGLVRDTDPRALVIAIHALCAYPFINKPMMCGALRMKSEEYDAYLANYADQAAEIMIRSMQK